MNLEEKFPSNKKGKKGFQKLTEKENTSEKEKEQSRDIVGKRYEETVGRPKKTVPLSRKIYHFFRI